MKRILSQFFGWSFRIAVFAAVVGAFVGVPYAYFSVRAQRFVYALMLTVLFGRFFCSKLCPLGFVQDIVNLLFHPRRRVRRVCTRLPVSRRQLAVRWTIAALVGIGIACSFGPATTILPMSIFGKTIALWYPGIALMALVVLSAAIGEGRVWCNWVCPYGTVFSLLEKISLRKNKVGRGCAACGACGFTIVRKPASDPDDKAGVTRRETLKGVAVLAVVDKVTDGGFAPVSSPGEAEGRVILPPGAVDLTSFSRKCVGCQLCVVRCPGKCLRPSVSLRRFGQPELAFTDGYCLADCVACSTVCPESAMLRLQREQRPYVHVGFAEWHRDRCLRATEDESCTACVRKCPVQAIHIVKGFPIVDRGACIGCGACEHVCPSRPLPAITVTGYAEQRIVNPISEADLVAEMRTILEKGAAVVLAKDGVIVGEEKGRGIAPILKLLDEGRLEGVLALDRVVGRAAAAIYIVGGAKKVYADLAATGAKELLAAHGIALVAAKTVKTIANRTQTDMCPMERAVYDLEDPVAMVAALREAVR